MDGKGVWNLKDRSFTFGPAEAWPDREPKVGTIEGKAGEKLDLPEGWFPRRSSFNDMIVRDGAVLAVRPRLNGTQSEFDWAWLRGGELGPVLVGLGADEIVDLDGDRMIAISRKHGTLDLLDRRAQPLRRLREPTAEIAKEAR